MHELSIACGILDAAEEAIGPGKRLIRVNVTLGPLSGICAESLEFCFSEIAQSRGLGVPALEIDKHPVQAICANCSTHYAAEHLEQSCPDCGSLVRHISGGFDCQIESVTFEESESHAIPAPE